jgi:uncharacterized SAM-binding protein YcdF (DUF218 family)
MKFVLKILGKLLVLLIVVDILFVLSLGLYQPSWKNRDIDAGVVLGAAIYSTTLYKRTEKAVQLTQDGVTDTLVLSGGRIAKYDITEAEDMQRIVRQLAPKPTPALLLEKTAHNTYENLKESKKLIPDADSIVIISDRFHLPRAVLLAKRMGFKEVAWASPDLKHYKPGEIAFYYVREMLAMLSYIPHFIFG